MFTNLFVKPSEWLSSTGGESRIVVSSRVRLARNIAGREFVRGMAATAREELCRTVEGILIKKDIVPAQRVLKVDELNDVERRLLVERHLISRDMADGDGPRSVAVSNDEAVSIMIIEEDHLRIQVLRSGFDLKAAYRFADELDDAIESELPYTFHHRFGYLTACPTNVGTGLRVSVMIHLPALVLTRHIDKVIQAGNQMQLAVRGIYGEGTEPLGQFFQISNQITLGRSEDELIERLEAVIPQIIDYEHTARQTLLFKDRRRLEDHIWRAYGQLKYARTISSDETMKLLSLVRLGVQLELLPDQDINVINELLIYTQPAHLQIVAGKQMAPETRDAMRADYIREKLGNA